MSEREEQATSIPGLVRGQLCYLQIPALDITASARFYESIFGWQVDPPEAGFEAPGLIGQWVTDRAPAPDAGPVGWIHVPDVRTTLTDVRSAGGTVRDEPIPDGPRLLASFADPAGNLVGIVQHGDHAPRTDERPVAVENRTMPPCTVIPELVYDDVTEAIGWLCDAFGLIERWRAGDHRAQLSIGRCTVAITEPRTSNVRPGARNLLIRVPDAGAHHERARASGATIIREPTDFPYGERQYTAEDLGGHRWTFSQSIADVAPEEWGGTSGPGCILCVRSGRGAGGGGSRVAGDLGDADRPRRRRGDRLVRRRAGRAGAVEPRRRGRPARRRRSVLPARGQPAQPGRDQPRPRPASPASASSCSSTIPTAFVERALAAGATPRSAVVDHEVPWGTHRQGGFRDPFGHNWSVGDRSPLRPT